MAAKITYLFEIFHVSFVKLIKILVVIFSPFIRYTADKEPYTAKRITSESRDGTTVTPLLCIFTPSLQRADCRNGVLLINKVSADDDEFVTLYVVSDRMGEGDCLTVID